MAGPFTETSDWQGAAWAMAIWAVHFSVLWGASSIFPNADAARWIAAAATLGALVALAALHLRCQRWSKRSVQPAATGLAALAIVFGALPAVFG
jgi:hypothetical protein